MSTQQKPVLTTQQRLLAKKLLKPSLYRLVLNNVAAANFLIEWLQYREQVAVDGIFEVKLSTDLFSIPDWLELMMAVTNSRFYPEGTTVRLIKVTEKTQAIPIIAVSTAMVEMETDLSLTQVLVVGFDLDQWEWKVVPLGEYKERDDEHEEADDGSVDRIDYKDDDNDRVIIFTRK